MSQKMIKFVVNILSPILYCIFYYFLPFYSLNSFTDAILFGLPWSTLASLYAHMFISDIVWHSFYLSITCYYFKIKLSYINHRIEECESSSNAINLMKQLNSLHLEIYKCNSLFWSSHLADSFFQ